MKKYPKIVAICLMSASLTVSGCSWLPKGPSKADARMVYVWPMSVCPSQAAGDGGPKVFFLAPLATALIGIGVNTLVGIPTQALQNAAEADKNGFQASSTNARFYYTLKINTEFREDSASKKNSGVSKKNAGVSKYLPSLPTCYVVAYAKPASTSKPWCDDTNFNSGAKDTCTYGKGRLSTLKIIENLKNEGSNSIDSLDVPDLYAEISLVPASYSGEIVRPMIVALYYPHSLLQPHSNAPRTTTLGIDFTSPLPNDPFKVAQVVLIFPHIVPGPTISVSEFTYAQTGWTTVPSTNIPPPPDKTSQLDGPYLPVTVKGSLSEAGDPSLFLAAFAKAANSGAGGVGTAVSNLVDPTARTTNENLQVTNSANYSSALSAAQSSRANILIACNPTPTSPQLKAALQALFSTAIANQLKANVAASVAEKPSPFPDPNSVTGISTACQAAGS